MIAPVKKTAMVKTTESVVAIGASTGGTEALKQVLPKLPVTFRVLSWSNICRKA